ncbi:phosphoadenosine phosphosulfate reductase [Meinhardsimonia xiamenensis]|jgi:phosphoadenosine phosphosulfate reductase|uniref:Adenosine 5'-phosphosulfate reductase n=1 Tax=Meinhardsimonia xiamenensis TaxID=990712 RepID=A0A1G9F775_9RHOB|nr:phosphoadenylyl-sulfate reductase [Meinhardsimonia xiamenensis]PRX37961.1 phosphoadenosine phosphosulfate reductase [Meinhardsimonia xiamenensis]SDK84195.1 phosphoadenosine phosphosulfate reductase [Meinhardsimonia xiamenensis]
MPLDAETRTLAERAAALDARLEGAAAEEILAAALAEEALAPLALVSSFGAESVVLLHMVSRLEPSLPVLFLDTEMLFAETLAYQRRLAEELGLKDVRRITPDRAEVLRRDPDGILHLSDPDGCCTLRKTEPLAAALEGFAAWITGRKRYQGGARRALPVVEAETGTGRLKINPLARWSAEEVRGYMDAHELPRHPLVSLGYRSIGCAPCTQPTSDDEDPRAGRWPGRAKTECGIHFIGGRAVRGPGPDGAAARG